MKSAAFSRPIELKHSITLWEDNRRTRTSDTQKTDSVFIGAYLLHFISIHDSFMSPQ